MRIAFGRLSSPAYSSRALSRSGGTLTATSVESILGLPIFLISETLAFAIHF